MNDSSNFVLILLFFLLNSRYNDLYRDLEYNNIRDPDVRLALVNEVDAVKYLPGPSYGKIRLFQDNFKDLAVEKLGYYGQRLNNLVFGRSGNFIVHS